MMIFFLCVLYSYNCILIFIWSTVILVGRLPKGSCQNILTRFGNGFRQEVPDRDDFDFILRGSAGTASNPELHNTSWYESVTWTTQDQKQREITIHFVKRDEMLQNPEDTLLMIEGKINCKSINSYGTVSILCMYKVKIC